MGSILDQWIAWKLVEAAPASEAENTENGLAPRMEGIIRKWEIDRRSIIDSNIPSVERARGTMDLVVR
jgi:hypothetical protein